MKRLSLIALAGAFALLASLAHAQPKPALVQDVDGPARNPYQHSMVRNDCGGETNCQIDFDAVPAGMRLVVTQVSIEASVANGSEPLYLRFGNTVLTARAAFTVPGPGSPRLATFPLTMVFSPGAGPRAYVFVGSSTLAASVVVSVVGYLVSL